MNDFILNLVLTALQLVGNPNGNCILLSFADWKEFVDGKATGNIIGIKLNVVCPTNNYMKLVVKIRGGKCTLTNEQLQQKSGQPIALKNLRGKFYRDGNGSYQLSTEADGFEVA